MTNFAPYPKACTNVYLMKYCWTKPCDGLTLFVPGDEAKTQGCFIPQKLESASDVALFHIGSPFINFSDKLFKLHFNKQNSKQQFNGFLSEPGC